MPWTKFNSITDHQMIKYLAQAPRRSVDYVCGIFDLFSFFI